jgi:hypothetical protein
VLLLEDVPNDEQAIMERLGMPDGSVWAWMACPTPVRRSTGETALVLRGKDHRLEEVRPTAALEDWYGLSFEMFGRVILPDDHADGHPYWRLGGIAVLEVWHGRAFNVDEGVEAIAVWSPKHAGRPLVTAAGEAWTRRSVEKARLAVHALRAFARTATQRHRQAENPEAGWVTLTKKAVAWKHARGDRTWKQAASHVGIGVRQLHTWRDDLKRLPKIADLMP